MRILLELDAEVARSWLHAAGAPVAPPRAVELKRLATQLGLDLQPLHPGVADAPLATWFFADLADEGETAAKLERFRHCAAVNAAYAKPVDAAPL